MRAARPWLASLFLHAAALGLGALCVARAPVGEPRAPIAIELAILPPVSDEVRLDPAGSESDEPGRPAAGEPASHSAQPGAPSSQNDRGPDAARASVSVARAELGLALGAGEPNLLAGQGEGGGGRGGRGGGTGTGGADSRRAPSWTQLDVATAEPPPPPAVPPPRSKARPARLIYPKLLRRERPGEVFIALLKIDREGFVSGVELEQGVNPHQDEKALDAVWRFRYAPALDHTGRPIASRVHQRFMLR